MSEFSGAASSMSDIVTSANGLVAREANTAYLRFSGSRRGGGVRVRAYSKLGTC